MSEADEDKKAGRYKVYGSMDGFIDSLTEDNGEKMEYNALTAPIIQAELEAKKRSGMMKKPVEVEFRDFESKRMREALEEWRMYPDDSHAQEARARIADYVHAQALVADLVQAHRWQTKVESLHAECEARRKIIEAGLLP